MTDTADPADALTDAPEAAPSGPLAR